MINVYSCSCGYVEKRFAENQAVATATLTERVYISKTERKGKAFTGNYFSFSLSLSMSNEVFFLNRKASGRRNHFSLPPQVIFFFHDIKNSIARVTKEGFLRKSIVVLAIFMSTDIQRTVVMQRPSEWKYRGDAFKANRDNFSPQAIKISLDGKSILMVLYIQKPK